MPRIGPDFLDGACCSIVTIPTDQQQIIFKFNNNNNNNNNNVGNYKVMRICVVIFHI